MTKITTIIADDQTLIRDGLAAILTMEGIYTVVATTGDGLDTIEQVQLLRPQLVLMDIHMPKLDGLQATKQIKLGFPNTKIIILTTFEDEAYIIEAIRYGADGFIVKGTETDTILSIIEDCMNGRISFPSHIQDRLMQALNPEDQLEDKLNRLSEQERNIVRILKQGKSNQAIAADLFLTTGTVKNYLITIYKKLDVASRSEAIAYLHKQDH